MRAEAVPPFLVGDRETGPGRQHPTPPPPIREFVPETRFGLWFLNTQTWSDRVLKVALDDLRRMMEHPEAHYPVVLDVGCGHGRSLPLLMDAFRPERLIGLDCERNVLANARSRAAKIGRTVTPMLGNCSRLPLRDGSVDLIFCHQTFHHLVDQEQSLREFWRVLRPSGLLLFAESTRAYIESWTIRLLFRHPMQVQRSAETYLAMLRGHGFVIAPNAISCPYLWWSRADLGVAERLLRIPPRRPGQREETLLNVVAMKGEAHWPDVIGAQLTGAQPLADGTPAL
ncbi:MAG: methyltransferase domain-containing protein [Acetobacteraceae bacterium]|jgi:ubiquinone/menaquinone biosynthesis C-methylase UbiE